MTYALGILVWLLFVVLFGALGVHHFIKARRALQTGVIEGLMLGYGGKRYSREDDPAAFAVNVWTGFVAAAIGAIVVLWGTLLIMIQIMVAFGIDRWP